MEGNVEGHQRCCVGACNNDIRYPGRITKRGDVATMDWFQLPPEETTRESWIRAIRKGRKHFFPNGKTPYYVCSNHFISGEPTDDDLHPVYFLTPTDMAASTPQRKFKRPPPRKRIMETSHENTIVPTLPDDQPEDLPSSQSIKIAMEPISVRILPCLTTF